MTDRIDLHTHTLCSDGSDAPAQVVALAKAHGLRAVAITDHDTFVGHAEALEAGARLGIEVVPGVELSATYAGEPIHLLAYYADTENPALRAWMRKAVEERRKRNETMVQRLHDAGYPVDMDMLRAEYPGQSMLGRPHVAEHLMKQGVVSSIREGVVELMGRGKPFYVERYHVPLLEYVQAVRAAGGVPVIAHLYQYRFNEDTRRRMVAEAAEAGLLGLEGMYSTYTPEQQESVFQLAKAHGLLCTGGSDYHGTRKPHIALGSGMGNLAVPYDFLEEVKGVRT